MKAAAKNILVVIAASVFGLVLAMNLPQSTRVDNEVAPNLTSANSGSDLVNSVDWSKVKQEPMSPTF